MRLWKIIATSLAFALTGCALFEPPRLTASSKTDVALLQFRKIAVIKFNNPKNEPAGQEAAAILALGFVKRGYNVVGGTQIAALIDQDEIYRSGLTPEIKAKLKSFGIDSVVTGRVDEYFCSRTDSVLALLKESGDNHCSVTASARMLDLDSGEIAWGATGSDAQDGRWVTADSVLRSVMQNMREAIPNLEQLRNIVSQNRSKPQMPQGQSTFQPQPQPQPRSSVPQSSPR